jgi:hypothetical protein
MRLGDRNFLNIFALLAANSNPGRTRHQWQVDGVSWTRERTSRQGPGYCAEVETFIISHTGKASWTLLCVHETWWEESQRKAFRNMRWVHLLNGARTDVVSWFSARQAILEDKVR